MAKKKMKSGAVKKKTISKKARYPDSIKKKVLSAVKKGMTHLEASKTFSVGVHSIPKWVRAHA